MDSNTDNGEKIKKVMLSLREFVLDKGHSPGLLMDVLANYLTAMAVQTDTKEEFLGFLSRIWDKNKDRLATYKEKEAGDGKTSTN